jgi:ABC-2 type transport system permease protein
MLWYKAWLETRTRFLISLFGILSLCSLSVLHGERQAEPWTPRTYHNYILSDGYGMLAIMCVLSVTLLMMGGLLREQALGSASFTLSLPVSRRRHMLVRIGLGALQAVVIAIVPAVAMYLIASACSAPFSLFQNLFRLTLLLTGGAVFFAIAILVASLVPGEYTPPVVAFGVLLFTSATLGDAKTRLFSPLAFMIGSEYLDRHSNLLVGPIPWIGVVGWLFLAAVLTWLAVYVMEKREF